MKKNKGKYREVTELQEGAMSVSNYAASQNCTPPYIYKLWKTNKAKFEIVIFSGNNYIIPE